MALRRGVCDVGFATHKNVGSVDLKIWEKASGTKRWKRGRFLEEGVELWIYILPPDQNIQVYLTLSKPSVARPPNDDGYMNRTLAPILAAGGCRLTTAEPSRLQRAVVITQ